MRSLYLQFRTSFRVIILENTMLFGASLYWFNWLWFTYLRTAVRTDKAVQIEFSHQGTGHFRETFALPVGLKKNYNLDSEFNFF